jgi:hypothetical protein
MMSSILNRLNIKQSRTKPRIPSEFHAFALLTYTIKSSVLSVNDSHCVVGECGWLCDEPSAREVPLEKPFDLIINQPHVTEWKVNAFHVSTAKVRPDPLLDGGSTHLGRKGSLYRPVYQFFDRRVESFKVTVPILVLLVVVLAEEFSQYIRASTAHHHEISASAHI